MASKELAGALVKPFVATPYRHLAMIRGRKLRGVAMIPSNFNVCIATI
jgi:hypothetical protein